MTIEIGTWHAEQKEITHCPSYYAADTETLQLKAGDYPARIKFQGGFTVPMPQWLLVSIPSVRVRGRLYSGFGGVNYAHTELKAGEAVDYNVQLDCRSIKTCVENGALTLAPEWEWLASEIPWRHPDAPKTWDELKTRAKQ